MKRIKKDNRVYNTFDFGLRKRRSRFLSLTGFTLVEIMIVVAIIALLAAIAIPNFVKSRHEARMTACISNMRVIDSAIQQYLLHSKLPEADYGSITFGILKETGFLHGEPHCPVARGVSYSITTEKGVECPSASPNYHGYYKNGIHYPPG